MRKEARRVNDAFVEAHHDDALFGYMLRESSDYETTDWNVVNDPVIHRLLRMGIYDWQDPDKELHQAKRAIRFSTALSSRILKRVLTVEQKVSDLSIGLIKSDLRLLLA